MTALAEFREVWAVDFEFHAPTGNRPQPLCMVAKELHSGATIRLRQDELEALDRAPFSTGSDSLFVAYYASAELGCFCVLGWPMPANVLDLFAEFRCATNGRETPGGRGLLGALAAYGLDAIGAVEKDTMRQLAIRGGPFTDAERLDLMDYCQTDVEALGKLLPKMAAEIDLPRAILRGRYMAAAARMEAVGVPIDVEKLSELRSGWEAIKRKLVAAVDESFNVFVPTGQRTLTRDNPTDAAILDLAEAEGVDADLLAAAVDDTWREECEAGEEFRRSVIGARKDSGLTVNRIDRLEDAGHDHASWPGLDATARTVAREYPALGIGHGFTDDGSHDRSDYAGRLWPILRDSDVRRPKKTDRKILDLALRRVVGGENSDAGGTLSFSAVKFAEWLAKSGIPWPRLDSGALDLSDETFRQMARQYPAVAPLRELRYSLSQLRLNDLAAGSDGRNRCLLSAFQARTGRNQPSNSKYIFGPSVWLRALIRPEAGRALAYVDWSAQEIGIAAALSGDTAMMDAYRAGDPYLWLAKAEKYAPADATKRTHGPVRDVFKIVYLAANYGMGEKSLGQLVGRPPAYARELLRLHRDCFPKFWAWSDGALAHAMLKGKLWTVFGWTLHVGPDARATSLRNFPVQGNGAEMLRLACCLTTEAGIDVAAPVHDALLVEGPESDIEGTVRETQRLMREASEIVLDGFPLRTDAKVIRSGERYLDPRGERMWETVSGLLDEVKETELQCVPF